MKNTLVAFLLLFNLVSGISQKVKFGMGVGLHLSNLKTIGFQLDEPKFKPGILLYTFFDYTFSDKFGIRIEPGFIDRKARTYFSSSNSSNNQYYLTSPILLRFTPIDRFFIYGGLEPEIHLGSYEQNNLIFNNQFDLGINTGFSYKIMDRLEFGFRYNRGIISAVNKNVYIVRFVNGNAIEGKVRAFNQGLSLTLNYAFN